MLKKAKVGVTSHHSSLGIIYQNQCGGGFISVRILLHKERQSSTGCELNVKYSTL